MRTSIALTAALAVLAAMPALATDMPIIGIFTQPVESEFASLGKYYVPASYIKYIESAGGRAMPIPFNSSQAELQDIFHNINGILYPGGGSSSNDAAKQMFEIARQANENGDFFPVWGTCDGFEWLVNFVADESIIVGGFDSENYTIPLDFTNGVDNSLMFHNASKDIMTWLAKKPITMNNHQGGIEPDNFQKNEKLSAFYNILSTNVDRNNRPFVSTIEGRDGWAFGTQFHPEKPLFEWGRVNGHFYEVINHSTYAVQSMQYLADFFVFTARRNTHTPNPDIKLFDHYSATYTMNLNPGFIQCYFFD